MGTLRSRIGESLIALREAFDNPDLRRVECAWAGSAIGTYAYSIAVIVYAYHHGGATAVGVFMFVRLAIAASIAPVIGSLADRFPRQRVMLASDLTRAATVGATAIVATSGAPAVAVYVLATLTTILGTIFRPAEAALLPVLARSPQELTAANVSASTLDSLGSFVGPALGALLLSFSGPPVVFAVVAGTFAWSAAFLVRVRAPADEGRSLESQDSETFRGLAGGLRAIRAEPRLRLLIALYGAQCLVAGALGVLVVVTALEVLSLGNSGVGLLEAASGVGSLIGAAVALALIGRGRLAGDFALGIVLWGAPLVLLGAFPNVAVAILALGIVGLGNTLVDISAMTLLQRTTPAEVAGRVFGVLESVTTGSVAVGFLSVPILIAAIGSRGTLLAVGALLPILAALTWRQLARIDDGATVPAEQLISLRGVPFLAPLPLQSLEFLAMRLTPTTLAEGETLFSRGDPGERFYILREGSLEIDLSDATKVEHAPAFVGEIALLRDIPRTATVRAATDASLWALERSDFLDTVSSHARSRASANELASARLGAVPVG
jgi:hypothetical protein